MDSITTISSVQNPQIKAVCLLQQKSSQRRKEGLFVVEGRRELMHCIQQGYEVEKLYICPEILNAADTRERSSKGEEARQINKLIADKPIYNVTPQVYDKMAYRGGTEGIIATVRQKTHTLDNLSQENPTPLYVVIEGIEKPGNLGAILRTADAAGVDAVIVCDPHVDVYNPNLIRSSMGAVFSTDIAVCTSAECISMLKERGIKILTAQLQDSRLYYDTDMTCSTAIVMGTEDTGLTPQWREAAEAHIRIPMLGAMDSLNVSVSAAILIFEAVRQRNSILTYK